MPQSPRRERADHPKQTIRMRKGGQQLKVAATFAPVRDAAGRTVQILSIAHDVTEARPGKLVRRESEERFRVMADSTPVMIKSAGVDGELDFVNKACSSSRGPDGRDPRDRLGRAISPRGFARLFRIPHSPPSASGGCFSTSTGSVAMTASIDGLSTLTYRASTPMVNSLDTSAQT